jgi:hypothetical protein
MSSSGLIPCVSYAAKSTEDVRGSIRISCATVARLLIGPATDC